jgi:hypothetical protein
MQYFDGQVRQLVQNRNNLGINIYGCRTSPDQSSSVNTPQLPASSSAAVLLHRTAFVTTSGW